MSERFDELWTDYLEGNLNEAGLAALDDLLASDPELLRRAASLYGDHRLLGRLLRPADGEAFAAESIRRLASDGDRFVAGVRQRIRGDGGGDDETSAALPVRSIRRRKRSWAVWLPWLVSALACVAVGVLARRESPVQTVASDSGGETPPATLPSGEEENAVTALLVNEVDARFADGAAPDSVRFRPGVYELLKGAVHLRFSCGADVVITSPARFAIHDPMRMTLERGSLRALVSPSAHGFTVDAPGISYEDLGTEFGVFVAADRPRSEVHVFEGAVDVKSPDGRKLSRLGLGESASVDGGRVGPASPPDPLLYPTPADVGLLRWRHWRDRVKADPSLVCYYPFEERAGDPSVLADGTGWVDGRITGARWVSGRWPGKQALLFDRKGDAVEVTLPGEYRQLTIAAWVRVERLDFALNAVFDSDGWETGDIHLQLNRLGQPQGGVCGDPNLGASRDPSLWVCDAAVPVGRWAHLAAVVDLDRRQTRFYLDGFLVHTTPMTAADLGLRPGTCRIGDWQRRPDWPSVPQRGFRGRIDEFAIWGRALAESEIRECAEASPLSIPSIVTALPPAD